MPQNEPLELRAAKRLQRFVEHDFNPQSETSWETLRTMFRGALLARDIRRFMDDQQPEASK